MGRKKKSVLNQVVKEPVIKEEPKKEETKGLVYSEDYVEDPTIERTLVEKLPSTAIFEMSLKDIEESKEQEEISLKVSGEKLAEVLEEKKVEEVMELTILRPSPAQLAKLSKAGLRWYQRTGMLPK
jgi:hypothetical protein